jgi:hypothetical protein
VKILALRAEVTQLRKDYSEDEAVLRALHRKLDRETAGVRDDPRAHIRNLAEPVAQEEVRFNRTVEAWGAVSLILILLGIVALLVFARSHLWIGLLVMAIALVLIESVLRGHYGRTVSNIAAFLAIVSAFIVFFHYWFWIVVGVLVGLAVFLMIQKLREFRR